MTTPATTDTAAATAAGSYWVTWKDTADGTAARASALIWGPQASAPVQLSGMLQAGPFPTKAAATAYEDAIGTGAVIPPPGTPIIGDVQPGALGGLAGLASLGWLEDIGHWFGIAVTALTDKSTWISVGWLLLGLILVVIALYILGKKSDLIPSTVPVPVPV